METYAISRKGHIVCTASQLETELNAFSEQERQEMMTSLGLVERNLSLARWCPRTSLLGHDLTLIAPLQRSHARRILYWVFRVSTLLVIRRSVHGQSGRATLPTMR